MEQNNINLLINNFKKALLDPVKAKSIVENILSIDSLTLNSSNLQLEQLKANLDKIHVNTSSILSFVESNSSDNLTQSTKGGYVTICSTIELSIYDKISSIAKHQKTTINKMLIEWINIVINDKNALQTIKIDRLDHIGHQFKRIACCIPKQMLDLFENRLAQANMTKYQCIKLWAYKMAQSISNK